MPLGLAQLLSSSKAAGKPGQVTQLLFPHFWKDDPQTMVVLCDLFMDIEA
jgi:hypothetical protein